MDRKYQIFISSTFRDLVDERQDAMRSVLDLGHIPAGMELFPAADVTQLEYIKKIIDECDYYILIIGGRYGSLDAEGVSFTEREYEYALTTGKTVLAFVHGDTAAIPVGKSDTAPRMLEALGQFRDKVMAGRLVREWKTREQLEALVLKSLVHAISQFPAVGWVRANAAASQDILLQINQLRDENERLLKNNQKLQLESKPAVLDLAPLTDHFTVRYSYNYRFAGGTSRRNGSVIISWEDIIRAIGPAFRAPHTRAVIGSALAKWLKENNKIDVVGLVFDSDEATIQNQLTAHGYLKSYVAQAVNSGMTEFMQMTDKGLAKLVELSAIRSQ